MGATLRSLTSETATVRVKVVERASDDDPNAYISVTYRTRAHTKDMEERFLALSKDDRNAAAAIEIALARLVSWDLRADEDGPALPVSREVLEDPGFPIEILAPIFKAVSEDQKPDPKT